MKLLTLNTHSWREENADEKLMHLADTIIERDYDVVALQEVNQMVDEPYLEGSLLRSNNFMLKLLDLISSKNGPSYYGYWRASKCLDQYYEEGSCLLSKTPIAEEEVFTVSTAADNTARKKRNIVKVTIDHKGRKIDLYSCHMGWWHDEIEPFKPQFDRLMSKLDGSRLSLLLGDFNNNANLRNEGYDYILSKGLFDTYTLAEKKDSGATVEGEISGWAGNKEALRIDLILSSEKLAVKESKVIFNGEHYHVISDHFGVEVEISL